MSAPARLLHDVDLVDEKYKAGQKHVADCQEHEDVTKAHHHGLAMYDL
jgi:hypothetical protein